MKCGLIFSEYEKQEEKAKGAKGFAGESRTDERFASWESGEGFFSALLKTTKDSLFSPSQFFRKSAVGEGYLSPLIYGLIVGIIGLGGSMFWQWLLLSRFVPSRLLMMVPYDIPLTLLTIALPFIVLFSILLGSAITHVCLMIVGGNKTGFRTTFRTVSYSYSSHLFGVIPIIGSTIGSIYTLILVIIGVREGHRISTSRAVLAVLFPLILVVGLLIIALIFIPLFLGSMRFVGGVGV